MLTTYASNIGSVDLQYLSLAINNFISDIYTMAMELQRQGNENVINPVRLLLYNILELLMLL